ncbi:hypothetical protein D9757_007094 [Collybiopsis confluens]|uniref:Beta-glucuronidase C-terminal domain-containing protein n=1 Tax=Collybiopsis confluens TaxID=2823264 RepID=A0A8H5M4S8_9AGAR|nr:hypothetical protein D9757_007094 [Collybiopsis confluens]
MPDNFGKHEVGHSSLTSHGQLKFPETEFKGVHEHEEPLPPIGVMVTLISLAVVLTATATLVTSLQVSIPLTAPSNASIVPPDFISFSIEQDHWTDWVGSNTASKNQFFANVLDNIIQLTGTPPRFRIGADSEDRTDFQAGLQFTEEHTFPPSATTPYAEASNITVGEAFYLAAQNLPVGTHVTWGVNLKSDNVTAVFLEAQAIADAFKSSSKLTLDAIEIGNEPNEYHGTYRPDNYSIADYIKEWTTFATNISATVPINDDSTVKFWGGAFAGSATHNASGFAPQGLFGNGVQNSAAGQQIKTYAAHFYNMGGGANCGSISSCIQGLMSKTSIRGNLTQWIPDIAFVKSLGLDYVFGESNSYTGHGLANVSNSAGRSKPKTQIPYVAQPAVSSNCLGAALWLLDNVFHATQLGVDRFYFHEGVGYKYNFIQPVTLNVSITDGTPLNPPLPPHVQPLYYGAIIAAEIIGNEGGTLVTELSVNSSTISAYAIYTQDGTLSKALFINSEGFFTENSDGDRNSVHLDFSISGTAPSGISVKRLVINHADDTSGLTWAGQTYQTLDGKVGGTKSIGTGNVSDGVDIPATQAVLVAFN